MTQEEARETIKKISAKYGSAEAPPPTAKAPESLADVIAIIEADELHRYEAARNFADGKTGVEALVIRSFLELSWAGAMRTARDMLGELQTRLTVEISQHEKRADDAAKDKVEKLKERHADFGALRDALATLAGHHLEAGGELAMEARRTYPDNHRGYVAAAQFRRLKGQWLIYDNLVKFLDENGVVTPTVRYMKAMEALERRGEKQECRNALVALVADAPKLVRAQASLVLVQDDIADTHRELEVLRSINPRHIVSAIAGPGIDAEFKTASEVRAAMEPKPEPAPEGEQPAPAEPAPAEPAPAEPAPAEPSE